MYINVIVLFVLILGDDYDILFIGDDKCIHSLVPNMFNLRYTNPMLEAQVAMVPQTYVELTDEKDIKNLQKTLDLLDEDDDVTDVWTNWDE